MKAMVPSDAIDLNRPVATGRIMPPALVQEKAGLPKGASIPGDMCPRAQGTSRMNDHSRDPLFPIAIEERVVTNRHNEHLLFLLGETSELKVTRPGLLSSLKRMITRPPATANIPPPCSTLPYTPRSASPIPVPPEESPLFKVPAPMEIKAPPLEALQPKVSDIFGNIVHQGLSLQLRMALATTLTVNRAAGSPKKSTGVSPQPPLPRHTPPSHSLNRTSLVTPAMKNLFVEAVSEVATELDSNSFPLSGILSPLERAIAEARAAGYHLHKPVSLAPPPPTPESPRSCSVETQRVLHGDGLRRLVLCKNASTYPAHDVNGNETEKISSSSALHIAIQRIDFKGCLKRVGKGVGDDWVHRSRVMPSMVYLEVRLWDSKRKEEDKVEVQLEKALLRTSPLKRVLKNPSRRHSVELEKSHSIRRCLRSVRSNVHRHRVVGDLGAKRTNESTPSLVPVTRERRRDQVRNRVRAKRRDVSEGTSETLDKVRRWSDGWKRRARLMAVPRPDIETTRSGSDQAQRASALSALLTANAVDRRPDWFNLREHVESQHHNYLEEDTSDDEPMEHDDEIYLDGVCHTGCEPVFVSLPSPVDTSPSSKLSNSACLAVQVKEETQTKGGAGMVNDKHSRIPLLGVHSLKAFERQSKRA